MQAPNTPRPCRGCPKDHPCIRRSVAYDSTKTRRLSPRQICRSVRLLHANTAHRVRRAVECAGLTPLRLHDLRHTAVALWIAAGASPNEIASRAGHTSVAVVLDRYGHLLPGTEERVTDALDAMAKSARTVPRASVPRDPSLKVPRPPRGPTTAPLADVRVICPPTCAFVVGDTGLEPMTSAV